MRRHAPLLVLLLLLVLAAAQMAWYAPRLPEIVASHFDGAGTPNGWMPRRGFLEFYGGILAFLTVFAFVLGRLPRWLPDSAVNLPNKAYWLDPARREETHAFLCAWFGWFMNATMALLVAVMELSFRVNIGSAQGLGRAAPLLLAAYLGVSMMMTVFLMVRFSRAPWSREGIQ